MTNFDTTSSIATEAQLTGSIKTDVELIGTITPVENLAALLTHEVTYWKLDNDFSLESENGIMNKVITAKLMEMQQDTVTNYNSIQELKEEHVNFIPITSTQIDNLF